MKRFRRQKVMKMRWGMNSKHPHVANRIAYFCRRLDAHPKHSSDLSFLFDILASDQAKFQRDHQDILSILQPFTSELIPISAHELEEMSFLLSDKKKRRASGRAYQTGVCTTIFHEKIALYGWRDYAGKKKCNLIALTRPYVYAYKIKTGVAGAYINDRLFFRLTSQGNILDHRGRKEIGMVDFSGVHPEILLADREVASLNRKPVSVQHHDRVFQMIHGLDAGIHELVVGISLYYSLIQQIDIQFFK